MKSQTKSQSSAVKSPPIRRARRARRPVVARRALLRDEAASTEPTLEGEVQAIRDCIVKGEDAKWDMGFHFSVIVDRGLAQAEGYRDARSYFLTEVTDIALSNLQRASSVARAFPKPVAEKYGMSKLVLFLSLQRLQGSADKPDDPGDYPITVPVKDGEPQPKPFSQCSMVELSAAVRLVKGGPNQSKGPGADSAEVTQAKAALSAMGIGSDVASVSSTVKARQPWVRLEVSEDQLLTVLQGLAGALKGRAKPKVNGAPAATT